MTHEHDDENTFNLAKNNAYIQFQTEELRRSINSYKKEINDFLVDMRRDIAAKSVSDKTYIVRQFTNIENRLAGVENRIDKSINALQAQLSEMQTKASTNIWAVIIPAVMAATTAISVAYFNRGDINSNTQVIKEQQVKLNDLQKDANKQLEQSK